MIARFRFVTWSRIVHPLLWGAGLYRLREWVYGWWVPQYQWALALSWHDEATSWSELAAHYVERQLLEAVTG